MMDDLFSHLMCCCCCLEKKKAFLILSLLPLKQLYFYPPHCLRAEMCRRCGEGAENTEPNQCSGGEWTRPSSSSSAGFSAARTFSRAGGRNRRIHSAEFPYSRQNRVFLGVTTSSEAWEETSHSLALEAKTCLLITSSFISVLSEHGAGGINHRSLEPKQQTCLKRQIGDWKSCVLPLGGEREPQIS